MYTDSVNVDAAIDGSADYAHKLTAIDRDTIASARYKLTLNADTELTVEIVLKEAPADTVTVKVDGTEVTPTVSGNAYSVTISGIAANDLDFGNHVTMEIGENTVFGLTVSPISYVRLVLPGSTANDEKNALAALYEYWQAAEAYVSGQ